MRKARLRRRPDERRLAPDHRQLLRRVPVARDLDLRRGVVDSAEIGVRQLHLGGGEVRFKAVELGCLGTGRDGGALSQQSGLRV